MYLTMKKAPLVSARQGCEGYYAGGEVLFREFHKRRLLS